MKLTYVSHACVMLEHDGKVIVTDPFIKDLETAKSKFPQLFTPDVIVISHGHDDHLHNLKDVYKRGTQIVGIVELVSYLRQQGYGGLHGMNFGGKEYLAGAEIAPVPARHTSALSGTYLGEAAGFVITIGGQRVYFAGDTDVFGDMALIAERFKPTIGLLPIGGYYTMDAEGAAFCCNRYFDFSTVIPIHYDTFPAIATSTEPLRNGVKKGEVKVLKPFESIEF